MGSYAASRRYVYCRSGPFVSDWRLPLLVPYPTTARRPDEERIAERCAQMHEAIELLSRFGRQPTLLRYDKDARMRQWRRPQTPGLVQQLEVHAVMRHQQSSGVRRCE